MQILVLLGMYFDAVVIFVTSQTLFFQIGSGQIFRYGRSIFCVPHRPNFSDIFDLCLHWVSVVRGSGHTVIDWWYHLTFLSTQLNVAIFVIRKLRNKTYETPCR